MKKVSMVLLFTLVTMISFGQEFKKVFLGKDWNTYKGLHLKYKVGTIGGTTHNFYSSQPTKSFQSPVYGKTKQYDFVTDTNSIKDRDFLSRSLLAYDLVKKGFRVYLGSNFGINYLVKVWQTKDNGWWNVKGWGVYVISTGTVDTAVWASH